MLYFSMTPSNDAHPRKKLNSFYVDAHALSEAALDAYLCRMSEFVMGRGLRETHTDVEVLEYWISIDRFWQDVPYDRSKSLWPTFEIDYLLKFRGTVRPSAPPLHTDALCTLKVSLASPRSCSWYTHDRSVFAPRLLDHVARAWAETWDYWLRIEQPTNPRPKWPVKLWIHGYPDQVWQIADDGNLVELTDHPPVDESIVDPLFPAPVLPPPSPPRDLEVVEATTDQIVLRWRPSPQATAYHVQWSEDGEEFAGIDLLENDDAQPDRDGYVTFVNRIPAEANVFYYRVEACVGMIPFVHSDPSNVVRVALG